MAERIYAQQGEAGAGAGAGTAGGGAPGGETGGAKDDVVDAEFEEVKDDKK
jgi:molecular chaperone DnaK